MQNPFGLAGPVPSSFLPQDYIARKSDAKANIFLLSFFAIVMAAVVGAFMVTYRQKVELRQHLVSGDSPSTTPRPRRSSSSSSSAPSAPRSWKRPRLPPHSSNARPRGPSTRKSPCAWPPPCVCTSSRSSAPAPIPSPPRPRHAAPGQELDQQDRRRQEGRASDADRCRPVLPLQPHHHRRCQENNDIADFIRSLRESPILDDVELAYIREGKGDEVLPRKFETPAILRSDTDPDALSKSLQGLLVTRTAMMGLTPDGKPVDQAKDQKPSIASTLGKLLGVRGCGARTPRPPTRPTTRPPTVPSPTPRRTTREQRHPPAPRARDPHRPPRGQLHAVFRPFNIEIESDKN